MCPQPLISIFLAAMLAVGGVLSPRYACAGLDGTPSIDVGRPACVQSDRCEPKGFESQDGQCGPSCTGLQCSSHNCRSTRLADDPAVIIMHSNDIEHDDDPGLLPAVAHPGVSPAGWRHCRAPDAPPGDAVPYRRPGDGLFQCRFVVLLI